MGGKNLIQTVTVKVVPVQQMLIPHHKKAPAKAGALKSYSNPVTRDHLFDTVFVFIPFIQLLLFVVETRLAALYKDVTDGAALHIK